MAAFATAGMADMSLSDTAGAAPASVAEAAANGQLQVVDRLLSEGANIDTPGKDGTTPLCAAALWGDDTMVKYLLQHGAAVNVQNKATLWTPLHAAAFQEHGKVVHMLLQAKASVSARDHKGRTPSDYATISEAIWPFFAAQGCSRSTKADLVAKGIIRKTESTTPKGGAGGASGAAAAPARVPYNQVKHLSRPGSAYVRVAYDPTRPGSAIGDRHGRPVGGYKTIGAAKASGATGGGSGSGADLLAHIAEDSPAHAPAAGGRQPSFKGLTL